MNNILVLNPPISILRNLVIRVKFSRKMFLILGSISIAALLTSYIIQINSLAEETYKIQNYQQKIEKLGQENENLLSDALKLSSLPNIETIVNNSGFEKTQKIHYIQVQGKQVVTR